MHTVRKAQDSSVGAREALKKRGRARRNSANSLTASPCVVGSVSGVPRRRPRLIQPLDDASGPKHEKVGTFSTTSSSEGSCISRSTVFPESCTLNKSGSPKGKETVSQKGVNDTANGTPQSLQDSGSSLSTGEDVDQIGLKLRNVRQERVAATGRTCPHAILLEAATSDSSQEPLASAAHRINTQRSQLPSLEKGRIKTAHQNLADRNFVQDAPPASTGLFRIPKNTVSVAVDGDKCCLMAHDGHNQAPSARFDETGHMSQKSIASTSVIQLLLGKQLPSSTASAVSLLESRLRDKLVCSNGACGTAKPILPHDRVSHEEMISKGEEHENRYNSGSQNHTSTTTEGPESNGITCCSSNTSTLQTHAAPPLYYTVLTGNGLHTKQETAGNLVSFEEEVDHENYPVVKGVSRDNTKKRWAVYWKGSRKYFYDKCYADCHQAYLSAVEFRRQAKACNAPGAPPKKPPLQSEFYLPAPASSFRFTSYSPAITSFPLAPSTPPAFPTCETSSPCAGLLAKCGPTATTLSAAVPEHQVLASARNSDLSVSYNDREPAGSRTDPDPCISSPTTADSCDNLTDTLQVYRCAVIILLQDLLYEVLPPRIIALGPARRTSLPEPPLRARAEERFLSASLLLLQRTLQGHIAKAERGGEEDLNQLLLILMPSLDRQLLPSELPRELQQTMLLQLTTLRL